MANEAVIIELGPLQGASRSYTCASGTAITKGALLALTSPNTAAANTATERFAGIASADKSGTDYSTKIGAWTSGDFDILVTAGGPTATFLCGELVVLSGANTIKQCTTAAEISGGFVVGRAMEAGVAGTVIRVRLMGPN